MKKQNGQNRIIQAVTIGCISLMACLCVGATLYFNHMEKAAAQKAKETEAAETMVQEAGAVIGETKLAPRTLLDQPAIPAPGDKREVIRIVEVIPHEACSIFPYLVEWGSKEEYDKHTTLGYEGIQYMATSSGLAQFGSQGIYNYIEGGAIAETLNNYNVNFATIAGKQGTPLWWREAKPKEVINANGYFEYVGEGKGLYSVNLKPLVKDDSTDKNDIGIRYRVMPMERKGKESKKGEWEVKDAQYYWGKDYATESYPDTATKSRTDFNYDLEFTADASGMNADYRVRAVKTNTGARGAKTAGFEYEAYLTESAYLDWQDGFVYSPKGNYTVSSYTPVLVNDTTDRNGKYIRVLNSAKPDGVQGVDAGYFRLYSDAADKDTVKAGDLLYTLSFSHVKAGEGNYILSPSAVQSAIDTNLTDAVKKIFFEYAGDGIGSHDVVFIYAQAGGYSGKVTEVSEGEGRYALASTAVKEDELYEFLGKGQGDYSKVVTRIDCLGVDYNKTDEGWYGFTSPEPPIGVSIGRPYEQAVLEEKGAWVFHTVSSDEANGITKIEELEGGKIPANKRIYVYGQNRKNCYYARNTFKNNEWFKLLIYMADDSDTKSLAADAYAAGKTGQEVVEMYRDKIQEFDKSYRIEIIQRTPGNLTVEEVNSADLIYMSREVGIYGMASKAEYEKINSYIGGTLPPWPTELEFDGKFKFTSDFSDEVLMALYENCLYHEEDKTPTTAFIADIPALLKGVEAWKEGYPTINNFGKLNYLLDLFDDQADFADFIQGYAENREHWNNEDGYSTILPGDGCSINLYPYKHSTGVLTYNLGKVEGLPGEFLDETTDSQWKYPYFEVHQVISKPDGSKDIGDVINGDFDDFMGSGSVYRKDVEDDWTYWAPDPVGYMFEHPDKMLNIWKIMHNKTSKKQSAPKVIVTNADYMQIPDEVNVATDYFIYVDEYEAMDSDAFDLVYKVNWVPEEIANPTGLSSLTVKGSDGRMIWQMSAPSYETEYSCNVAGDFAGTEGQLNGAKMVQYLITAEDEKGKPDTAVVWVVVRDSFMLN